VALHKHGQQKQIKNSDLLLPEARLLFDIGPPAMVENGVGFRKMIVDLDYPVNTANLEETNIESPPARI
jgi:hypothetical protein